MEKEIIEEIVREKGLNLTINLNDKNLLKALINICKYYKIIEE